MATVNDDAAAIVASARQMLQEQGMPMNAENLNRAMIAIARGEVATAEPASRASTGRTRVSTQNQGPAWRDTAPVRLDADQNARDMLARDAAGPNNSPFETAVAAQLADGAPTPQGTVTVGPITDDAVDPPPPPAPPATRGDRIAAGERPGGRRAGTVNGAQRIAGYDAADGDVVADNIYSGTQPRQADETGVDPISLALSLGSVVPIGLGANNIRQAAIAARARGPLPGTPEFAKQAREIRRGPSSMIDESMRIPLRPGTGTRPLTEQALRNMLPQVRIARSR